jgi:multiple sugar transport system permease protein
MVWNWMLNNQFGLVNTALKAIGINGPNWLGDPHWGLVSVIIVGIWSALGYNMILLLGGLQDIPNEYYEAASIDGAGKARQLFSITMPLLSPTLFFVLVTSVISSLQVFDLIYMMIDRSSPILQDTESIVYLYFRETFTKGNTGFGSAIAVCLLIVISIITLFMMKLQKRWVTYDR